MNTNLTLDQLFLYRDFYISKLSEQGSTYSPNYSIAEEINSEYFQQCIDEIDSKLFKIFNYKLEND